MDATLKQNIGGYNYVVSIECRFDHAPKKVWQALTERELLRQWFPCDIVGAWQAGAALEFVFAPEQVVDVPDEYLHGKVLVVEEAQLLEFSWGSHGMKFELEPDGDGCIFRLSESFDDKAWCARNAAGWEMCLENLDRVLMAAPAAEFVPKVWREKFDRYAKQYEDVVGPRGGLPDGDPLLQLGCDTEAAR